MDPFAAKLAAHIAQHGLAIEQRVFDVSTHSVREAAEAVGAREDEFVKSICMLAQGASMLIVAVVKGEDRASTSRVQQALGLAERPRLATPEEMLSRSGFPAGGTPPFGFEATFLVDERVMERERVWAGGGSDRALVHLAPAELLRANGGRVARVRK